MKFTAFFLCLSIIRATAADNLLSFTNLLSQAQAGQPIAQTTLGFMYQSGGPGVLQNYEESIKWFTKAAAQGDVSAQYALGTCYLAGTGVPMDNQISMRIFHKLANEGHAPAQATLGKQFLNQALELEVREQISQQLIYVPSRAAEPYQTNLVFACKWLTLAKAAGQPCDKDLAETLAYMNPLSTRAGQTMASNFKPAPAKPLVLPKVTR